MDRIFRLKAGVYATLANAEKLADLPRSKKEKLVEDVREAGLLSSPLNVLKKAGSRQRVVRYTDPALIASWGNPYVPNEWLPIVNAHRWAYRIINKILSSGVIEEGDLAEFYKRLPQPVKWVLNESTGAVEERYDVIEQAENDLLLGLNELRQVRPFPFMCCKLCHTIFVRFGKQRFCSKRCTDKAVGSRNKYMRVYMKKRRKKERQERLMKEQATKRREK